jgi:hypothetical protein
LGGLEIRKGLLVKSKIYPAGQEPGDYEKEGGRAQERCEGKEEDADDV